MALAALLKAPQQPTPELGALLARWHAWRRGYSTERSYARQGGPSAPEDELELLLMRAVEAIVSELPQVQQRLVQQAARAECLGTGQQGDATPEGQALALAALRRRLISSGVL